MKENGRLFICSSSEVPKGDFVLAETDTDINSGDDVPGDDMTMLFASIDGSLADRLIAIGISRRENSQGKDTMLIINPQDSVEFD